MANKTNKTKQDSSTVLTAFKIFSSKRIAGSQSTLLRRFSVFTLSNAKD